MDKFTPGISTGEVVSEVIARRRSVRRFSEKPVDLPTLQRLVRAGIYAPSGSNFQNQRFLIINNPEEITAIGSSRFVWPYRGTRKEKIQERYPGGIIGLASALIIVFADSEENDRRNVGEYYIWETLEVQNCAASIENMLILATAMGLATCWVSASEKMNHTRLLSGETWRTVLASYEIPIHYKIQGVVLVGYPRDVDDLGFPKGESKHGATVWQSTERRPLEYYLVSKKTVSSKHPQLSMSTKIKLKILSALMYKLIKWVQLIDKKIHNVEIYGFLGHRSNDK